MQGGSEEGMEGKGGGLVEQINQTSLVARGGPDTNRVFKCFFHFNIIMLWATQLRFCQRSCALVRVSYPIMP